MGILGEMKLMTHNLLMCNKKGCTINNFPLKVTSSKLEIQSIPLDEDIVKRFLKKIDLPALTGATKELDLWKMSFEELKPEEFESKEVLSYLHHVLFEVMVIEGKLLCKGCNRDYEIRNGIPNLIYNDD